MPNGLCRVEIDGQQRDITDTDIERLIASDSKLMVQVAEGVGKHIRDVSSSHIRNIYGAVKQMEMSEFNYHELVLLKPKMAYAAKRAERDRSRTATDLKNILTAAIDAVGNNEDRFQRFADFFEAILAYHKAYGGR
jgi:CRISPR-associated protein Csm2